MKRNKSFLDKIKTIISNKFKYIAIGLLGKDLLTEEQLEDKNEEDSILDLVYDYNQLNDHGDKKAPKTHKAVKVQIEKESYKKSVSDVEDKLNANDNMANLIEKYKQDLLTTVSKIVTDSESRAKMVASISDGEQMRKKTKQEIKSEILKAADTSSYNFDRMITTEISNSVSLSSASRILKQNEDKDASDIIVYRIIVDDSTTCAWCRRFYVNKGFPKLYRLSTLIGNGTNYGKKRVDWKPVVASTHPNERCTAIIELKRNFQVEKDGSQSYLGRKEWESYIKSRIS